MKIIADIGITHVGVNATIAGHEQSAPETPLATKN
ncbi:MAG: hypothetical protein RIU70_839, partial [Actinomycetota bacterium]